MASKSRTDTGKLRFKEAMHGHLMKYLPKGKRQTQIDDIITLCFRVVLVDEITPTDLQEILGPLEIMLKDFKLVQRPLRQADEVLIELIGSLTKQEHRCFRDYLEEPLHPLEANHAAH